MRVSYYIGLLLLFITFVGCKKESTSKLIIETGTVTDAEGNTYKTVKIGEKWWMAENLRSKKFLDGTDLTLVGLFQEDSIWATSLSPTYTFINDSVYGCLYNQAAIQSSKGLAPEGWHIATDEDWKNLEMQIGMSGTEANNLAWRGTNEAELLLPAYSEGWPISTVPFGNDQFQMKVLPAGCKLFNGKSSIDGNKAFFWTSTTIGDQACYRYFDYQKKKIFRQYTYNQYGMSVRCVKD